MVPSAVEPIVQKDSHDCAIAALAMLLGRPYRDVSEAALKIGTRPHKTGLWNTEIKRIALHFGVQFTVRKSFQIPDEEPSGLLVLKRPGEAHCVLLFQGVIINPADGLIWDYDTFLTRGTWTFHSLFQPK